MRQELSRGSDQGRVKARAPYRRKCMHKVRDMHRGLPAESFGHHENLRRRSASPSGSRERIAMKPKQIIEILEAEAIGGRRDTLDIKTGCGADLMSDVLVFTKPGSILLTGLTSMQVIYTASTAGVAAICFVRGKSPPKETVDLAKKKKIALMATNLPMFESCGRLYKNGLIGCSESSGASGK